MSEFNWGLDTEDWEPLASAGLARSQALPLSFTHVDLDRVAAEYALQVGVQEAQAAKTVYGMQQLSELYRAARLTQRQTFELLSVLDATVIPGPYGRILQDSEHQMTLDYIDFMHKAHRLGAKNIAMEIDRTLYLPPSRPGPILLLLQKMVGGRQ